MEQMIDSRIGSFMNAKQYSLSKIQSHKHDGADAPRVRSKDLIYSTNRQSMVHAYADVKTEEETGTSYIEFAYPKRIDFNGFIANGAEGGATPSPSTEKATTSGLAVFGTAENISAFYPNTPTTEPDADSIVHGSNYMFIDETDLTNTWVGAGNPYLAFATDDGSNVIGYLSITSYSSEGITIEYYVDIGFYIIGSIIIT